MGKDGRAIKDLTKKGGKGNKKLNGSPVQVAPTWEGSDHYGSYVRSLSLHFCKRLFLGSCTVKN
jgi:hypothetical protein